MVGRLDREHCWWLRRDAGKQVRWSDSTSKSNAELELARLAAVDAAGEQYWMTGDVVVSELRPDPGVGENGAAVRNQALVLFETGREKTRISTTGDR